MMAAVAGQKINMSALTGTPGTTWSVVMAPANKKGTERANTRKKKLRGDLLRDAMVFKKSLSNDCGYAGRAQQEQCALPLHA